MPCELLPLFVAGPALREFRQDSIRLGFAGLIGPLAPLGGGAHDGENIAVQQFKVRLFAIGRDGHVRDLHVDDEVNSFPADGELVAQVAAEDRDVGLVRRPFDLHVPSDWRPVHEDRHVVIAIE